MVKTKKYLPSGIRSQLGTQKSVILNKKLSKKRTKVTVKSIKYLLSWASNPRPIAYQPLRQGLR